MCDTKCAAVRVDFATLRQVLSNCHLCSEKVKTSVSRGDLGLAVNKPAS